jgi:nicotinamidase/pyrazinamidase
MQRVDLFVIDGENDFCASGSEPLDWPWPVGGRRRGSLFVEGADQEAVGVAAMIDRLKEPNSKMGHKIHKIHATLDSHHRNDGSHNISWKDASGNSPPPFTIISHQDVKDQKYVPRFPIGVWHGKVIPSYQWALHYTEALQTQGRSPLCAWPVHCEIGTWGSNVYKPLMQAYDSWCATTGSWIDWITKGQWPFSEHYSAMQADVPDSTRPETQMNAGVVKDAMGADIIAWAGWAGSHCLRWTALDAANFFGSTGPNELLKKSVFFSDASAAVPDIVGAPFKFSDWRKEFLDEVANRGAKVMKTTEFLS